MAFLKLNFKPGVVRDTTDYANEGGFSDGDKVRFFSGFPQKLGGWVKGTPNTFLGVCRQIFNWITSLAVICWLLVQTSRSTSRQVVCSMTSPQ
jgi:hypothetical protein